MYVELPRELKAAFDTEKSLTFTAPRTETCSVTILVLGSNIPVRIRGVELLVMYHDTSEVSLGWQILKEIGFDLHKHLLSVHKEIRDKDISELASSFDKFTFSSYNNASAVRGSSYTCLPSNGRRSDLTSGSNIRQYRKG